MLRAWMSAPRSFMFVFRRIATPDRSAFFQTFTSDLHEIAAWLKRCRVTSVAMESTGIYWIPLYEVLEEAGFEVKLVNAREAKNMPGRKSDILDCQWIQQLHSYGLLTASFRPPKDIVALRSLVRHRDRLIVAR